MQNAKFTKQTPIVILALVASASAAAQQAQTGVRPVASVRQLHDLIITPASNAVFQAGGDAPATDGAWLDARNQALLLAESGNLLMLGSRARDNAAWMRMSRAMVDAAAAAAAAAERHDAAALAVAGDKITTACEACHQPYRDRGRQMGTPQ
jgi:hypothetical protein